MIKKEKNNNKKPKKAKSPHDEFSKRVLGDPIIAQELLEEYLPGHIKENLDLATLKVDQESHISKSLKKRLSDIIYSVKTKNNDQAFIYIMIEHQSSPDYWIAFRLWEYMLLLLESHMKNNEKLPIVIPLVLYNGKEKYSAPRNFWELFDNPLMAQNLMGSDYNLVDLESMSDDQFNYDKALSLINYVMKHIHERDLLLMIKNAMRICKTALIIDKRKNYVHFKHILWYINNKVPEDRKIELDELIDENLPTEDESEEIMRTIAQSYRDEGFEKGVVQGIEKAIIETAIKMLKLETDISFIQDVTGLTKQEILKIKSNL
jgi:predicted transposase/invertase (TIGR01784 family)